MGVLVFDIDGTISEGGKKIHPLICDCIKELSKDNNIVFASARPVRDMLPMMVGNISDALMIGCNGGMAYKNKEILYKNVIQDGIVNDVVKFLRVKSIPYVLDGLWSYSCSQVKHSFHNYIRSLSKFECSEDDVMNGGVTKILVLSEMHKNEITTYFSGKNELSVHSHRSDGFYDLTPFGNNKYVTLERFIKDTPYIAFGNDQNDYLVLDNAIVSVFVGHKNSYPYANYYVSMSYIPTLLGYFKTKYAYLIGDKDGC